MWMFVVAAYLAMSAVVFLAFWRDKRAATCGAWRTAESSLHLLELLGGWPGSLLALRILRHKSTKMSYRLTLWCIITLHIAGLGAWIWV